MATVNLLNNGSFERNSEWTLSSSATYSTENPSNGARSLRCVHTGSSPVLQAHQSRMLIPGKTYTLRANIKRSGVVGYYPSFLYQYTNGTYTYFDPPSSFINDLTDGVRSFTFTTPTDLNSNTAVQIRLNTAYVVGGSNGTVWIDDVQLLGDDGWYVGSGVGTGNNNIRNGSFEADGEWLFNSTTSGIVSGNAYQGTRCAHVSVQVGGASRNIEQNLAFVSGKPYTLSFFAKRLGKLEMSMSCSYKKASGVETSLYVSNRGACVSEEYTRQVFSFTFPTDISTNTARISINASPVGENADLWVDNVEVWGETFVPPGVTGTNRIVNSGFENADRWVVVSPAQLQSGNAYAGARCLMMPCDAAGNMTYAYQFPNIKPGSSYTMRFYAKRSGDVQVSAQLRYTTASGSPTLFLPAFRDVIGGSYSQQLCTFTVPADAISKEVTFFVTARAASGVAGTAWVDNVELWGDDPFYSSQFPAGELGKTKGGARIFNTTDTNNNTNLGEFPAGCKFICDGVDGTTVRLKFGSTMGGTLIRYIKTSDFERVGSVTSNVLERMILIADSLHGVTGNNLGLSGDYCANFMYWLVGATGLQAPNNLPYGQGYAYQARDYFVGRGEYFQRGDGTPQRGDWVFYKTIGKNDVAHVGLVTGVFGNQYYSVEGNAVGGRVEEASGSYSQSDGSCVYETKEVLGFARPSYS